jgi:addiction module RelB/DinJ family antitoxin
MISIYIQRKEVKVMSKTTQKAYRTEEPDYEEVKQILKDMGMTVPQAINMLFKRIIMEKQFPFTPAIVKTREEIEAEEIIYKYANTQEGKVLNFDTGENVEEFFND